MRQQIEQLCQYIQANPNQLTIDADATEINKYPRRPPTAITIVLS